MEESSYTAGTTHNPLQSYSAKRVAELLCCSTRHVYKLIEAGELAAFMIGTRGLRIRREGKAHGKGNCEFGRRGDAPVVCFHAESTDGLTMARSGKSAGKRK